MMITHTPRRRALSALDWTESRPSCASGLITSAVDRPTLAIRPPARSLYAWRLHSRAGVGDRSPPVTALSSRSHLIQSPYRTAVQRLSPRHFLPTVAAGHHSPRFERSRAAPPAKKCSALKNALPYSVRDIVDTRAP